MINFGGVEIAIVKGTIYECYCDKIALREIASVKNAGFKFFEVDFLFTVTNVIVL
jgi:hypothetical protein